MNNDILLQVWAAQTCGINPSEYDFHVKFTMKGRPLFFISVGDVSTRVRFPIREVLHALDVDFMENKGAAFVISDKAPEYAPSFLSAQDWDDEDNQAAVADMVEEMVNIQIEMACDRIKCGRFYSNVSTALGCSSVKLLSEDEEDLKDLQFITKAAMLLKQYQR
jgi:hypothetical protein